MANGISSVVDTAIKKEVGRSSVGSILRDYISLARPDHWFKNVFMIPGILAVFILHPQSLTLAMLPSVVLAVVTACLIASSNYVINEVLDARTDRAHPTKKFRPVPSGRIKPSVAYVEWLGLAALGLAIAWHINLPFFIVASLFWLQGVLYNIPPIRTKELPYLDVLSEAINNPIRFLLGWYAMGFLILPPSSLVIGYWMIGAYLMGAKRLAEYREINNREVAIAYRKSFSYYNERRLTMGLIYYSTGFMFFFAVMITKYRPEIILAAPFMMGFFSYYLKLTYRKNSIVQTPEKLFKEPLFIAYCLFCFVLVVLLACINLPWVSWALGLNVK